jgi:TonB family protein
MVARARLNCALLCLLFTAPLGAQSARQTAVWDVDYGERRCALMRLLRGDHPATLSLRLIPGNESVELHFVDSARTRPAFSGVLRIDVTFSPSGETLRGRGSYTQLAGAGPWVLEVNELPPAFLDRFGQSSAISVRTGSRGLAEMEIPQAGAGVRALRQCNDALLRNWGVDPDLRASLQRQPEIIGHWSDLFGSADYPQDALQRHVSGMATVRITIGTDGRLTDCTLLVTSGNTALDRVTCGILRERARLRPGLDRNGQPVAVTMIQSVGWATAPIELLNHN